MTNDEELADFLESYKDPREALLDYRIQERINAGSPPTRQEAKAMAQWVTYDLSPKP